MRRSFLFTGTSTWVLSTLRRAVLPSMVALSAFAIALPSAMAQTSTGNIRGYVRDARDSAIAEAQVIARSTDMGITRGALTNTLGFYSLAGLRPGRWALEVRRIGLSPQTRTVIVEIGKTLDANFTMATTTTQLAAVQVTAAPLVETKTSEIATNVTQAQIQ
jgi:hypothetical protein